MGRKRGGLFEAEVRRRHADEGAGLGDVRNTQKLACRPIFPLAELHADLPSHSRARRPTYQTASGLPTYLPTCPHADQPAHLPTCLTACPPPPPACICSAARVERWPGQNPCNTQRGSRDLFCVCRIVSFYVIFMSFHIMVCHLYGISCLDN